MKKISFLLCLLLTFAVLVACGKKEDPPSTETSSTTTAAPEEEGLVLSVSGEILIGVGDTKQVTAINKKTGMQTSTVRWSSDNKDVADVDFEGKITGKSDGTAVITATSVDGTQTASCTVKVTSELEGITLHTSELTINLGETAELSVGFIPENFKGAPLTWVSGDDSIASVENGVITANKCGNTTVAVSSGAFTDVCSVTVISPVKSVSLSEELIPMIKGNSVQLTATVLPADATDPSLTWTSSNPTAVSVSDTGLVTALAGGNSTITAKSSNGLTATCSVVVSVPVTGVSLTPTELALDPGATQKLTYSIAPVDANVQDVIWNSSNASVVSIDQNGEVKALKPGTAVITITTVEGYFTASCNVTVANVITGLSFEQTEGNLLIGQTLTLTPVKAPIDADPAVYTWTSSDAKVASVDEKGVVKALTAGKATITVATDKGVTAAYALTVIDPATIEVPITKIEAEKKEVTIGENFTLKVTVTPSNATEKYIIESRNPSIVVVNSDGTLKAVGIGNTLVSIYNEGKTVQTTCFVSVNDLSPEDRLILETDYSDKKAAIDREHEQALTDIGTKYDTDIQFWTDAINNTELKNETEYNKQKSAIEAQIAAADEATKAILQSELTSLVAEWEAYQVAVQSLNSLESSKEAELSAENTQYQQKIKELNEEFFMLFAGDNALQPAQPEQPVQTEQPE